MRSRHEGKPMLHKYTTKMTRNGVVTYHCSYCWKEKTNV